MWRGEETFADEDRAEFARVIGSRRSIRRLSDRPSPGVGVSVPGSTSPSEATRRYSYQPWSVKRIAALKSQIVPLDERLGAICADWERLAESIESAQEAIQDSSNRTEAET